MSAGASTSTAAKPVSPAAPSSIRKSPSRDRRALQRLQSRLLDGVTTIAVLAFLWRDPSFLNPWELDPIPWLAGFAFIRGGIAFYDHLVVMLIERSGSALLPTRTTGTPVRYVTLDAKSLVFLSINSLHEYTFVQRLCHYLWHSPSVPKAASQLGLLNTLGGLYVMFVVLDACYAPLHHVLHMPAIYPLIHKHHHRQHFPARGYLDAGNEHPLEHLIGVMCTWAAVLAAASTTGAHAATIFVFFNIHAALAMLNHSPYDVRWILMGIEYSVGNHEMHHRKFTVNYAQYCMWYDFAARTWCGYEGPREKRKSAETDADRVGKVEEEKKSD
uniref:Fatty acid hydroxylase domain-containing protein n=1 Tax=Odontella aurita TaxID=265563 RepID=A0A7S4JDP2_9STRA|mmetsp:Transcript_44448/g.135471  ORF Transcript_44448/g.135471 Transcript_44448/m.135471 type:complete len:329 (+) Transcript_44448:240-1226(+)